MHRTILLLLLFSLALPFSGLGIDCSRLKTSAEIHQYIQDARETIPVHRSEVSATFNVSPCERQECKKSNIKQRRSKASEIHMVAKNHYTRSFFVNGKNDPMCLVSKENRKFRCSECSPKYSNECRTFSTSSSIDGTNLDVEDIESLGSKDFEYTCKPLAKLPKYFKIIGRKKSGNSPYDLVEEYFEKKRGLLVKIDYYREGILRKVYRIYPKQYTRVGRQWIATKIRVRTTEGSEKQYIFETVLIAKKRGDQYMIYLNPADDPFLKNTELETLFFTN